MPKQDDPAHVQWIESENERLEARVAELEAQNKHDDEADTLCRNLLCEERDQMGAAYFAAMVALEKLDHQMHKAFPGAQVCQICEIIHEITLKFGRPIEPKG